jgi:hypothetical protein
LLSYGFVFVHVRLEHFLQCTLAHQSLISLALRREKKKTQQSSAVITWSVAGQQVGTEDGLQKARTGRKAPRGLRGLGRSDTTGRRY